jgi:hypothetical protein
VTAILAAEDILWFYIAMGDAVFVAILDGRKHLQERIPDLVLLGSIVVGSDGSEEIAATVEVEDEEIPSETAVDAVVTEVDVGIEGDCMGNFS